MSEDAIILPDDFPDYLRHCEDDAPVPSWEQVTRSAEAVNEEMTYHVSRIIAGDEETARDIWDAWPDNYRRSVALLIDKIYNEGWLDAVGRIEGWPWDGGFFFRPRASGRAAFAEIMESKSGEGDVYTEGSLRNGLFAYLNRRAHRGWQRGWMENDEGLAALHIGIFESGTIEVHLDVFNSLYTNGAPQSDVLKIPMLGAYNRAMFQLHRRWEQSEYASFARTSANLYHLMRGSVPLSF